MPKRFHLSKTACVTFGPPCTKIGQIIDVTMEGLTFHYAAGEKFPIGSHELDILLPHHGFYLRNLPFQMISDHQVETNGSNSGPVRRCEVKFGKLTDFQRARLELFIQHHTTGDPEA